MDPPLTDTNVFSIATNDNVTTATNDIVPSATNDIVPTATNDIAAALPFKNILLVNSDVLSLDAYTNSETLEIGYENTYTTDDVMQTLRTTISTHDMSLNRIGFAFHYSYYSSFGSKKTSIPLFINNEPFFTDSDLGDSVVTFSPNVQFMLDLIVVGGITHVDFLACDTLLDVKWRLYYQLLQSKTGTVIGASDNNTGSLKYGGDWIMESTYEDVGQIYFTAAIDNWASLLAIPTGLNTYYHTFYTVDATDLAKMTRRIYNNTGTLLDTQDISYGGVNITTALAIMDGGGTNPYTVGIVDASLNKICMDVAYCGVYKKPFSEIQRGKLMTYVNTYKKEPHTYMTKIFTITVSGGYFWVATVPSIVAVRQPLLTLSGGYIYLFDQSETSNSGLLCTMKLSTSSISDTNYTVGVQTNSTPGSLNSYTTVLPITTQHLYCNKDKTFNELVSTAKFYFNADSTADYTLSGTNVTKWKNKIIGGIDASANITNTTMYPTIVTNVPGCLTMPFMKLAGSDHLQNVGFDYNGGAKTVSEPNQQTFFMFGYMYGINTKTVWNFGAFLSKPGAYGVGGKNTLHIIWNNYSPNVAQLTVLNSTGQASSSNTILGYTGSGNFNPGYYMMSITVDCSGVNLVNMRAYGVTDVSPNTCYTIDDGTSNKAYTTNDTSALHQFNIGYWNSTGETRSLNSAVGEVMYFNRILSTNERYILEGKIAHKYNKSAMLPTGHPYKSSPPL